MHIEKHSDLSKSFYGKKTLIILVFSRVLRDSIGRYVGPLVGWSVGRSTVSVLLNF